MSSERYLLVDPEEPVAGALVVIAPERSVSVLAEVQQSPTPTRFLVRAVLSDRIPLVGDPATVLKDEGSHRLLTTERPLTFFLHWGGSNAWFVDLMPGTGEQVRYVEVEVETKTPRFAFRIGRSAVGRLLDSLMRTEWMPLVIMRLDLVRKADGLVLCHELLMPLVGGVRMGVLGGIHQTPELAAYEAIIREAITSTSPYYRLLCAFRLFEGLNPLRRRLRDVADRLGVTEPLPRELRVDLDLVRRLGFSDEFMRGMKTSQDVVEAFRGLRNRVAHFLVEDESPNPTVDLSEGWTYQEYCMASAIVLRFVVESFRELRLYHARHLEGKLSIGSVHPEVRSRERYVLRPDALWERPLPPGAAPGTEPQSSEASGA